MVTLADWNITPFKAYDTAKMMKEGQLNWISSVKDVVWDE
jgi:hypothetical protein